VLPAAANDLRELVMTAEATNKQFRNCGNVSDRWKHAWLIGMLNVIVEHLDDNEPLTYAETNTFLLGAPTHHGEDWLAWAERAPRSAAMDRYVALERRHVEGGRYRCSAGLAIDILSNRACYILAENDDATRRRLVSDVEGERVRGVVVLRDAAEFATVQIGPTGALVLVVDPFSDVNSHWSAVCVAVARLHRADSPAAVLAFDYVEPPDDPRWPAAPVGLVDPVVTLRKGPCCLAAYASSDLAEPLKHALGPIGDHRRFDDPGV
jgi:hypothetical protein